MEITASIRENWLTRKPPNPAFVVTFLLSAFLFFATFFYLQDFWGAQDWMTASPKSVFQNHEYWRLWTTLFAHADLGHVLSNALLFIPFTYFLAGYYGAVLFPLAGLALGGVTNWIVLKTMPEQVQLLGISGVVYWMGSVWLTLYLLIDRRDRLRRRFGAALFLTLMLFVPETLKPEVSHLSHFMGYVLGIFTAVFYYAIHRKKFLRAERVEYVIHHQLEWEEEALERETQAG